ncbi:MAG: S26 family signal peptidase [Betaproteobacteria bacterium]
MRPTNANLVKLFKNNTFQTTLIIVVVILLIAGFYLAERQGYIVVVPSGSMCIPEDGACDGWTHAFERTLHVGDILLVLPMAPESLKANYPDSDIIVFHDPTDTGQLIVHRIINKTEVDGSLYFNTKGDGNGNKWPEPPLFALDKWDFFTPPGVSQDLIIGKVVLRVPWIGHLTLFMQGKSGSTVNAFVVPFIVLLIILIVILEVIWPLIKTRQKHTE